MKKNMQNKREKQNLVYFKELIYNKDVYQFSLKYEKLNQAYFSLILNETKYQNFFKAESETEKEFLKTIIQNCKDSDIIIKKISDNKASLIIKISLGIRISYEIDLEKFEKAKKNKNYEIFNYNVDEIINKCKKGDFQGIYFNQIENGYIIEIDNDNKYIIFLSKINVDIIKNRKIILKSAIRTNYEIKSLLINNNIDIKNVYINGHKLIEKINLIFLYVKNDILLLNLVENKMPKAEFWKSPLDIEKNYTPKEYSEFFYEYFPNDKHEDKIIVYENSTKRKEIYGNIMLLFDDKQINKYLITGPYASGKSMTLFRISKTNRNIIYINLKTLKNNQHDKDKCLRIILSECSRVCLNSNDFNKKFESFNFSQNILKQLINILEIILDLSPRPIILILDQYKSANISSEKGFMSKIDNLISNKKLKVIKCSSINDNEIRDLLIPTWKKFFSNPPEFNAEYQIYYFYYSDLYNPIYNTYSQQLFRNNHKYMKILEDNKSSISKGLEKISKEITDKIKKFKNYIDIIEKRDICDLKLDDILLFLNKNMNKKFAKHMFMDIVSICPLKFIIVDIQGDSFTIKPLFSFLEYFLVKSIEKSDCDSFFKSDRFKTLSFLTNNIKGDYFEFAVKKAICDKNILNFNYNGEIKTVIVDTIYKMDKLIINSYQNIIEKLSMDEKKDEIIKEISIDEGIKDENDYIEIKKGQKIDESKIEETIRKRFIEYYSMSKIDKNYQKYKDVINDIELGCLKDLDNFKNDEIELRINDRKVQFLKKYKNIKKIEKDIKIKISDIDDNFKKLKYTGDEIIFIDQYNKYGKMVDYGMLLGKRKDKTFIAFQMKCYSGDTLLDNKFLSKISIKESIQAILLNCQDLFNCEIKNWYYYTIFYYNKDDEALNCVGYRAQLQLLKSNMDYLLYDPKQKHFLTLNYHIIKTLNLTEEANLDYEEYLNIRSNYQSLESKFDDELNNINTKEYKKKYWEEFELFLKAFKSYGKSAKEILANLSKLLKVKSLYYCGCFKSQNFENPTLNKILIYKKKNDNGFISIWRNINGIVIYDLQDIKRLSLKQELLRENVDLQKKFYVLSTKENFRKPSSYYLRENIFKKLEEKKIFEEK